MRWQPLKTPERYRQANSMRHNQGWRVSLLALACWIQFVFCVAAAAQAVDSSRGGGGEPRNVSDPTYPPVTTHETMYGRRLAEDCAVTVGGSTFDLTKLSRELAVGPLTDSYSAFDRQFFFISPCLELSLPQSHDLSRIDGSLPPMETQNLHNKEDNNGSQLPKPHKSVTQAPKFGRAMSNHCLRRNKLLVVYPEPAWTVEAKVVNSLILKTKLEAHFAITAQSALRFLQNDAKQLRGVVVVIPSRSGRSDEQRRLSIVRSIREAEQSAAGATEAQANIESQKSQQQRSRHEEGKKTPPGSTRIAVLSSSASMRQAMDAGANLISRLVVEDLEELLQCEGGTADSIHDKNASKMNEVKQRTDAVANSLLGSDKLTLTSEDVQKTTAAGALAPPIQFKSLTSPISSRAFVYKEEHHLGQSLGNTFVAARVKKVIEDANGRYSKLFGLRLLFYGGDVCQEDARAAGQKLATDVEEYEDQAKIILEQTDTESQPTDAAESPKRSLALYLWCVDDTVSDSVPAQLRFASPVSSKNHLHTAREDYTSLPFGPAGTFGTPATSQIQRGPCLYVMEWYSVAACAVQQDTASGLLRKPAKESSVVDEGGGKEFVSGQISGQYDLQARRQRTKSTAKVADKSIYVVIMITVLVPCVSLLCLLTVDRVRNRRRETEYRRLEQMLHMQ